MPYQLLVNGSVVMTGNVAVTAFFIVIGLGIVVLLARLLWNKLSENERMKYEFVTIIAHKFRTPLTQVKWLLEGLIQNEQDTFKKESMGEMAKANENLIKMTASLVELTDSDAASTSSYSFETADLCELAKTVSDRFKNALHEKNLFFSVQCLSQGVTAKIDRARMEFVVETLLENAVSYSPPGRDVQITVAAEKNKAVISVKDNGIGIDGRDIPRIFSKFFRAENAQRIDTEGFGVGLFLAQSVARRHKGKITVYSDGLDKGSTFSVVLPLVR